VAVDAHLAADDKLLGMAAGSDSGTRDYFL
jgi:hypothetical protein